MHIHPKSPNPLKTPAALLALAGLALLGICACDGGPPPADAGKVPVTTDSAAAREHFLAGRSLAENLRPADARKRFERAVAEDPDFALAHLGLANTAPGAREFFASLDAAVAAAEPASEGERWMVLAAQAGANGDAVRQKELAQMLVEAYPEDERAHNLLGNILFGQQDFEGARAELARAIELAPDFAPAYNMLGYCQRTLGDYGAAEEAFTAYIERIPEEPNPYDSYAELLMKMGRFRESIANYERALSKNQRFVPSYVGIGNNQVLLGEPEKARETFERLAYVAHNDGERRQAMLWTAASYLHEGRYGEAVAALEERLGVAEASGDLVTAAGDRVLLGMVDLAAGDYDGAQERFTASMETMDGSNASHEVKETARRNHLYNQARLALAQGEPEAAHALIEEYRHQAEANRSPGAIRLVHELRGEELLALGDADGALEALALANQQDPRVLYLQALAHQHKGDEPAMHEMARRAAEFNALNVGWALVKARAEGLLGEES